MILASQSCRDSEWAPPLSFIPLFLGASRELIYPTFINMLAQQNMTQTCPDSARSAATTVHFPRAFFHSRLMPFRESKSRSRCECDTSNGRPRGRPRCPLIMQRLDNPAPLGPMRLFNFWSLAAARALSENASLHAHTHTDLTIFGQLYLNNRLM